MMTLKVGRLGYATRSARGRGMVVMFKETAVQKCER